MCSPCPSPCLSPATFIWVSKQQVWQVHTLLLLILEEVVGPGRLGTMRMTETWT